MQSEKSCEVYHMETHGNVKKANDRCYATLVFVIKHLKGNNKTVNSNNFG